MVVFWDCNMKPLLVATSHLELIRFVSSYKPVIAATKVSEKIDTVITGFLVSPAPTQDLAVMETMQLAINGVVKAVFDGSNDFTRQMLMSNLHYVEHILQRLIALKWTEPALVEVLVHYLDAMGPFLKYFPDAVGSDTSMHSARHARLQNCTSFIRISKAADKSILPYMKVWLVALFCYLNLDASISTPHCTRWEQEGCMSNRSMHKAWSQPTKSSSIHLTHPHVRKTPNHETVHPPLAIGK
ncbi:hypothetical protein VNO80_29678 [Phaseolus coccineus]|uniref:Exportin-5 C-terminal domain-containing protein n=1 Tax=Phaseolus coccineus TaxID=3886 RepID=A0AAN9LCI1_PHACN